MRNLFIVLVSISFSVVGYAQLDESKPNSFSHPLLKTMKDSVEAGVYEEITSILIARDGKLIYEQYFQGNDVNSKHNVRSGTKTMATLLTGIALQEGQIKTVDEPIYAYLDYKWPVKNPDPRKKKIKIEDLLTMSSIMECDDNNSFSNGHEENMYIIEDWSKFYLDLPIRSYPYSPRPEDSPYGRSMSYCSAGAATMAEVLQSAVGEDLGKFAETHLFQPLGISDYTLHFTPMNVLNTAGGSEYRSRDFMKMIQLMINKGKWNGKQLIPESFLLAATTPKANAWEGMDYGYFMWLKSFGKEKKARSYAMAGNGGNKIVAFPELGVTVVLTTTNYNNRRAHGYTDELLNEYIIPSLTK